MSLAKKVFMKSPLFLKNIFINLEALRRDYYRRWGNYKKIYDSISKDELINHDHKNLQNVLFLEVISYVKNNVAAYKNINNVESLDDIDKLPVLQKEDLKSNIDNYISTKTKKKQLLRCSTSGSTGKPLRFYKDRECVRYNYIYADKMLEVVGLTKQDIKCRFSGVNLFEFDKSTPPFWIYINKYRQLQCSSYHLTESNFTLYIDAIKNYGVTFGTGYANTWLFLAKYILKNNYPVPQLKAIVTDSEGLTDTQQDIVEKAFKCKVYQTYGLGEVGQIAFQCKNRNYHIIPQTAFVEIVDDKFNKVKDGEEGQVLVTSLYSKKTPFIRYATGDLGVLGVDLCECGWNTPYFTEIIGRIEDYVLIGDKKVKRLGFIMRPAVGVISSQLVQVNSNLILINIIPDKDFKADSMNEVIRNARDYLGNINIEWRLVNELEKTNNGKIRYIIRKI